MDQDPTPGTPQKAGHAPVTPGPATGHAPAIPGPATGDTPAIPASVTGHTAAIPAPADQDAPAVVVHGAAQADAALRAAGPRGVLLLSAPGAAGSLGAPWFLALVARAAARLDPPPPHRALLDCGAAPGHALAALRAGARALVLDPGCPAWPAIAGAAAEAGALLLPARPPAFDLAGRDLRHPGARAALAAWLGGGAPDDRRVEAG